MKRILQIVVVVCLLSTLSQLSTVFAQSTAFTYQGRLNNNNATANGNYDFVFTLYNNSQPGSQVGLAETNRAVVVSNGLFTTLVDFGNVFTGSSNWLEIAVSTNGANSFTTLAPRQQLTPAPCAITAENVSGTIPSAGLTSIGNNNGGSENFFIGAAGNATTTGSFNTANGAYALQYNSTGDQNTANGVGALNANTTGYYNTANGVEALAANTTGYYNSANGNQALNQNTTGYENTANGVYALADNTTGLANTANGVDALRSNRSGNWNTATGVEALYNNQIGHWNTANGFDALYNSTTGDYNIAVGYSAGYYITTGNNNIDIGNYGLPSDNNIIRIGTPGTQTATYLAGNVAIGATSPVAQLDVEGSDDSGNFLLPIALIRNNDKGSAAAPSLTVAGMGNTGNGVLCVTTAGTGLLARFGNAYTWVADIKTNGTIDALSFNTTSDRNVKENFSTVSAKAVLEKVVSLPISKWNFKQNAGINHIGPMAQDFHAAFDLNGADDKHISVVDEGGVALAAIQGLNQKLESENTKLKKQNDSLQKQLNELKQAVEALTEKELR